MDQPPVDELVDMAIKITIPHPSHPSSRSPSSSLNIMYPNPYDGTPSSPEIGPREKKRKEMKFEFEN